MYSVSVKAENSLALTTVQDKFFEYLDVSTATLKAYRAGVKHFITFTQLNSVKAPSRETVLKFK